MAISTTYKEIQRKFNPNYWDSIEEFEEYYLRSLSEKLGDTNYYTGKDGKEITISPINHHPELKEYEVWIQGYAATGESGGAFLWGKAKARNFAQACHIVACENKLKNIKEENDPNNKKYCTPGRWDYDPNSLSYWACKLYCSKELARKTFG